MSALGRLFGALPALALLAGCEPPTGPARDQWLVIIGTDAPVPQLGDRVMVEVRDATGAIACDGCRSQFPAGAAERWPLSFAVLPPPDGRELSVRAVLYRTDHVGSGGLPLGAAHIEAMGLLPPASAVTRVALELAMDCFGVPSDPEAGLSCDRATGMLAPLSPLVVVDEDAPALSPGSWPPAQPRDCPAPVREGMVCVPGGVLLLGAVGGFGDHYQPERLVQLSPFALDAFEVTTREVKVLFERGDISREPVPTGAPRSIEEACNYDPDSSARDELPINCLDHALAAEICEAMGKRLPTEAEWEWAAGNLTLESTYPWGDDGDDICDDAVVGRGRFPPEVATSSGESDTCRGLAGSEGAPWGPVAEPSGRDVTELGIHHLAGNVSEHVADVFERYDDPCWQPEARLLIDPGCPVTAGNVAPVSIRGGSWSSRRIQARGYERDSLTYNGWLPSTGVRCAVSVVP